MYGKNPAYKSVSSTQTVEVKPKKNKTVLDFFKNWFS
mgnify:CR=1 FL=1